MTEPKGEGYDPVGERVRIFRRGRVWYANFQHQGQQHRVSLKTTNKKRAVVEAARLDDQLARGAYRAAATATVAEAVTAYMTYQRAEGRAAKTISKYEGILNRVTSMATERKVRELTGLTLTFLDEYRRRRVAANRKPKTVYTESNVVRQLTKFAASRGMVPADPLAGAKLKKPKPAKQPCWTRDEVDRILAASPPAVRPALTLLAETGMRVGELAWLTWADIDLRQNTLTVQEKPGWRPKSGDQRVVPLSSAARAVVTALPHAHRWVVTMPPSPRQPAAGRQWCPRRLLAALKGVLRRVGLVGKVHTFRHAFISHALLKGTPEATVRSWVGHVSAETIRLYTHVHTAASQEAMRQLAGGQPPPGGE